MTSAEFKQQFKVGDKICLSEWKSNWYIEIIFIGQVKFFAADQNGMEDSWVTAFDWLPYTEPVKKVKVAPYQYVLKQDNGELLFSTSASLYETDENFINNESANWEINTKAILKFRRVTELEVEVII